MYYSYVLQSEKDNGFYVGFTKDFKLRFEIHERDVVESTKNRKSLKLINYEACLNQKDATKRDKYLKTYNGRRFFYDRLKSYLNLNSPLLVGVKRKSRLRAAGIGILAFRLLDP